MLQVIPSFYAKYSRNSLFNSANTYKKYILSQEYCIAHHDAELCFLPKCSYRFLMLGNVEELLQKLDTLCFRYQYVDCLCTLSKHRFTGNFVVKSGQVFDNVQKAVCFNKINHGVDRMPSIAKKRLLKKKYRKHLLNTFQHTKSGQTKGSVCAKGIELV